MIYGTIASNRIIHDSTPVPPQPGTFFGEFTMEDVGDKLIFKQGTSQGKLILSKDNVNWFNIPFSTQDNVYTGSLKWYLRKEYGTQPILRMQGSEFIRIDNFIASDIDIFAAFSHCEKLHTVTNLNVSEAVSLEDLFAYCKKLVNLPSVISTPECTNFSGMFESCEALVDAPMLDTGKGTDFSDMFALCTLLENVPQYNYEKAIYMNGVFIGCSSIEHLGDFNTVLTQRINEIFNNCIKLKCIKSINTVSNQFQHNMFDNTPALIRPNSTEKAQIEAIPGIDWTNDAPCPIPVPADLYGEFTMESTSDMFKVHGTYSDYASIQYSDDGVTWSDVLSSGLSKNNSLKWYIRQKPGAPVCESISFLDSDFISIDVLNVSHIKDFYYAFNDCAKITEIPSLDTSNGTTFKMAFEGCDSLVKLGSIDTSNGTEFFAMFRGDTNIECISSLDTTSGTSKDNLFRDCTSLQHPDATEQADLTDTDGAVYSYNCP